MALFNLGTAGKLLYEADDIQKIKSYLYRQNDLLKYMFNNLSPEDNYSPASYEKYVQDGKNASRILQTVDEISLEMLTEDNVVSAINLSREGVKIQGEKISLEGLVTVNSYFRVGLDGSIEARNGKFSGNISASTMDSSEITLGGNGMDGKVIVLDTMDQEIGRWDKNGIDVKQGSIRGTDILLGGQGTAGSMTIQDENAVVIGRWTKTGVEVYKGTLDIKTSRNFVFHAGSDKIRIGDFEVNEDYDRQIIESYDEVTGMSAEPGGTGRMYLWAGFNGSEATTAFYVDNTRDHGYGNVVIHGGLFVNGTDVMQEISDLWDAVDNSGGPGA